jgi:DNA-binding Lrp family transcriptional regulator
MRYTTIIDITEWPQLYRSESIRLVYLHLCLTSGYHDHDRDMSSKSIRTIARETGLTIAAVRHAIDRLTSAQLLSRSGTAMQVKKWVIEQPITTRAKTKKQQDKAIANAIEMAYKMEAEERREKEEKLQKEIRKTGKTPFMIYYESLIAKAEAGDVEAASLVKQHKATYELHKKQTKP